MTKKVNQKIKHNCHCNRYVSNKEKYYESSFRIIGPFSACSFDTKRSEKFY